MRIELLEHAIRDLLNGYAFYERQESGLGRYFFDALMSDVDSLRVYAGVHGSIDGYHRMLSKRFPYAIYYKVPEVEQLAQVYAVLDCRRAPEHTLEQLAGRS